MQATLNCSCKEENSLEDKMWPIAFEYSLTFKFENVIYST